MAAEFITNSVAALKAWKNSSAAGQAGRWALLCLCCCQATAQAVSNGSAPGLVESRDPGASEEPWSFSAALNGYFPPDAGNYLQPTLTADHGWLHLEVRYNYEALDTASAWLGYNFIGGDEVEWDFSPMLGGVFGKLSGVAPGFEGSLRWRRLELYGEGEYVIDTADSSGSYFYNWSELTFSALDWWRIGVVAQHTHVYQTDRDIQRGLLVRFSYRSMELTGNVFNLDDTNPTFVIALRTSW
jgi:hypothetical protein